jgi:hypothetical protein
MIARSDPVDAIGKIALVEGDIQGGRFNLRQLRAITRFLSHSAIREIALVDAYGDIIGFCSGEHGAVAVFQLVLAGRHVIFVV